jgi:hypothetical protein
VTEAVFIIFDRVSALRSLFLDGLEGGERSPAVVLEMVEAILSDTDLLRAMQDVSYFLQNAPPIDLHP